MRNAWKRPERCAMLYSRIAVTTIHMIGQRAKTAPAITVLMASPTGNCQPKIATSSPTISPASEACQAGRRAQPSSTSTTRIGSAATRNDGKSELPMGVNSW
jgi:hypothetical protein